jgi:hypothetical protein
MILICIKQMFKCEVFCFEDAKKIIVRKYLFDCRNIRFIKSLLNYTCTKD